MKRPARRVVLTRSLDPRVISEHAARVEDVRLVVQACADAVAYVAMLAFSKQGDCSEDVDASIGIARRVCESRALDGDAGYASEVLDSLYRTTQNNVGVYNERRMGFTREPEPIIWSATWAAYWLLAIVRGPASMPPGGIDEHGRTRPMIARFQVEECLRYCRVGAYNAGESAGAALTFLKSVNGGLRPPE